MLSPFVTNLLISIAQAEAKLHYEYKRAMDHAEGDEQKNAMGISAIAHGRVAQFFGTLAQVRLAAHQGNPDAGLR
jgi:Flp pilus assembly protein TadD